jgi:hypothetical protein
MAADDISRILTRDDSAEPPPPPPLAGSFSTSASIPSASFSLSASVCFSVISPERAKTFLPPKSVGVHASPPPLLPAVTDVV